MKYLRNKNAPPLAGLVQHYIDSAYDTVKLVADNLGMLQSISDAIIAGTVLTVEQIDTLAELNAILTDATLVDILDVATALQGALADTALQPEDLNTYAKLNALIADVTIASTAYVDLKVAGLYDHQGAYDADTNTPDLDVAPSGINKGFAYTVSVGGVFFTAAVEAGDVLIADIDNPTLETDWTIVNRNIDSSAFATAQQGAKADTALQAIDLDTLAELNALISDATLIDTTDSRLSDARTPLTHNHTESEISDLQAYLLAADLAGYAQLAVAQEYTKTQNFNATTLTDAANIAWDAESNQVCSVVLTASRILDNPTNLKDGATYILMVKQDGVGSHTLSYGTAYKWEGGTAPTLSTGINAVDILTFICDGTNMYGVAAKDFS